MGAEVLTGDQHWKAQLSMGGESPWSGWNA